MKQTINESQFIESFTKMGREDNFTYAGRVALFDYLTDFEESTGEEMELDVIAICCDFTEWTNMEEFQNDHGGTYETMEDIENVTTVIMVDGERFITQAF